MTRVTIISVAVVPELPATTPCSKRLWPSVDQDVVQLDRETQRPLDRIRLCNRARVLREDIPSSQSRRKALDWRRRRGKAD